MTKPEILQVVKLMHRDWKNSFDVGFDVFCFTNKTNDGFCMYLASLYTAYQNQYNLVKSELYNDLINKTIMIYWYPVVTSYNNLNKIQVRELLKPRIYHLQRTITRLENEIKSEN